MIHQAPMASNSNEDTSTIKSWPIDSGANVFSADPDGSTVLKVHGPSVPMSATAGVCTAQRATLNTPTGIREGLVLKGSARIIPASAISEKGHVHIGKTECTASYDGITFKPETINGIPISKYR